MLQTQCAFNLPTMDSTIHKQKPFPDEKLGELQCSRHNVKDFFKVINMPKRCS